MATELVREVGGNDLRRILGCADASLIRCGDLDGLRVDTATKAAMHNGGMDPYGPTTDADADSSSDRAVGTRPPSLPERVRSALGFLPGPVRWVVVGLVGSTLVVAGVAMLVLPGPGLLTVFAGVAILAAEFTWAEILLRRMKAAGEATWSLVRRRPRPEPTR